LSAAETVQSFRPNFPTLEDDFAKTTVMPAIEPVIYGPDQEQFAGLISARPVRRDR
jgi:hypothetical protein